MNLKLLILSAVTGLFLTSCAGTYKAINADNLMYSNTQVCNDKLEISYVYDVYSLSDNKKYARKEKNNEYRTIAIRIRNLTDTSRIITTDNFRIYANNLTELLVENKSDYLRSVSQQSGLYLLHGLWGPWKYESWVKSDGTSGGKLSYLPIGLVVGVGNMIVAASSNARHKKEITDAEIFGKTIAPGSFITGIVVLKYNRYDPLYFKYFDK